MYKHEICRLDLEYLAWCCFHTFCVQCPRNWTDLHVGCESVGLIWLWLSHVELAIIGAIYRGVAITVFDVSCPLQSKNHNKTLVKSVNQNQGILQVVEFFLLASRYVRHESVNRRIGCIAHDLPMRGFRRWLVRCLVPCSASLLLQCCLNFLEVVSYRRCQEWWVSSRSKLLWGIEAIVCFAGYWGVGLRC